MFASTHTASASTHTAAIALGSNLSSRFGNPADNLREAVRRLGDLGEVSAVSSFYTTAPVGYTDQPDFTNAAALLETTLGPVELLRGLLATERAMGRDRSAAVPAKGPRIIDLDLLMYGDLVLADPELTLPHPAMHERRFVLEPLAEIAPDMRHPFFGRTIAELLNGYGAAAAAKRERRRLFWSLTVLNGFVAVALGYLLWSIVAALAAFAAGIEPWATNLVVALVLSGPCLAAGALLLGRRLRSRTSRRVGMAINAVPALLYALLLCGWVLITIKTTRRRFVLPAGFQGNVFVIHVPGRGDPGRKGWWRTTYDVPAGGVLITSDAGAEGMLSDEYDYRGANGKLQRIADFDAGTMPDTPENRRDTTSIGVYFPRSGSGASVNGCTVSFDEVYVGSKARLLANGKETEVTGYLDAHPELCAGKK